MFDIVLLQNVPEEAQCQTWREASHSLFSHTGLAGGAEDRSPHREMTTLQS